MGYEGLLGILPARNIVATRLILIDVTFGASVECEMESETKRPPNGWRMFVYFVTGFVCAGMLLVILITHAIEKAPENPVAVLITTLLLLISTWGMGLFVEGAFAHRNHEIDRLTTQRNRVTNDFHSKCRECEARTDESDRRYRLLMNVYNQLILAIERMHASRRGSTQALSDAVMVERQQAVLRVLEIIVVEEFCSDVIEETLLSLPPEAISDAILAAELLRDPKHKKYAELFKRLVEKSPSRR